jgi:hypothetical protein
VRRSNRSNKHLHHRRKYGRGTGDAATALAGVRPFGLRASNPLGAFAPSHEVTGIFTTARRARLSARQWLPGEQAKPDWPCGRRFVDEVSGFFTTWNWQPLSRLTVNSIQVAALSMARRLSEPFKVRPACGVRLAPRSLRQAPRLRARAHVRAGPGIRVSRSGSRREISTGSFGQQKTLRSQAREGP